MAAMVLSVILWLCSCSVFSRKAQRSSNCFTRSSSAAICSLFVSCLLILPPSFDKMQGDADDRRHDSKADAGCKHTPLYIRDTLFKCLYALLKHVMRASIQFVLLKHLDAPVILGMDCIGGIHLAVDFGARDEMTCLAVKLRPKLIHAFEARHHCRRCQIR